MHYPQRQTMINAIPSGSLFFFQIYLFLLIFLCVFLSTSTGIYNTQLPGAFIFFFVPTTFVCCLPIHSRSVRGKKNRTKMYLLSLVQKDTASRSYFLTSLFFSIIIWYPPASLHYTNRYYWVLFFSPLFLLSDSVSTSPISFVNITPKKFFRRVRALSCLAVYFVTLLF
jgi:hypothetical protein